MQSNPEFVAEQRRWLGAYQAGSARKYFAERRKNDPSFKLLQNLRGRINSALKGAGKSKGTMHLIGCPIAELKAHLEKQFAPGMTWSNYGEWHVDHIVPCRSFDLRRPDDQHRCFHFTNLQPLWADDNFKKSGTPESVIIHLSYRQRPVSVVRRRDPAQDFAAVLPAPITRNSSR